MRKRLHTCVALTLAGCFGFPVQAAPIVGACQVFPSNHLFNTRIDNLPAHPDSAAFIKRIGANYSGSTYTGSTARQLHLDFGTQTNALNMSTYYGVPYNVLNTSTTPAMWKRLIFGYGGVGGGSEVAGWNAPDESDCAVQSSPGVFTPLFPCTPAPGTFTYMPIPPIGTGAGGANELKIEGGVPSVTAAGDPSDPANAYNEYGDHHILTIDSATCTLWEAYHAYPQAGSASATAWEVLSTARFDLNSNALRQAGITSSDAAGLPVFPLLLRADEANAGPDGIQHPLRFTISRNRIRAEYVWPARHLTDSYPADGTPGDDGLRPPMGQLFRLPASFDITTVPGWPAGQAPHAQTVAMVNAMKRYGMYLADGGSNMYIQGEPSASWSSTAFTQIARIPHTAFEAVDLNPIKNRPGFNVNSAAVPPLSIRSDANGDGRSDLFWHNGVTGQLYELQANGPLLSGGAIIDMRSDPAWKVAAIADLNGDGRADVVWQHDATGQVYGLLLNGTAISGEGTIYNEPNVNWKIVGAGDFNGDGNADLLWKNGVTGDVFLLLLNGLSVVSGGVIYAEPNTNWQIQKVADFNGDGRADVLWRNVATGDVFVLLMNGTTVIGGGVVYSEPNTAWQIQAAADFNGDGRADVLWRNTATGDVFMMLMNGTAITGGSVFYGEPNADWKIAATGDYNGNGSADILWRNTVTRQVFMMLMNGFTIAQGDFAYTEPDQNWTILGP
jgi:hypothetical protein